MRTTEDILTPPEQEQVEAALRRFASAAAKTYGPELSGLFLFGSRARGDHQPFSDADIAVVLDRAEVRPIAEKRRLARLAHDILIETGVEIQPWPVGLSAWSHPEAHANPGLVRNMLRDAKRVPGP